MLYRAACCEIVFRDSVSSVTCLRLLTHSKHLKQQRHVYRFYTGLFSGGVFVCEMMFELWSRLVHMYRSSGPGEPDGCVKNAGLSASPAGPELSKTKEEKIPTLQEFLQHARRLSGLKKENLFCNLRIPNQFQTSRQEINLIILTGAGVYCIDVMPWRGVVSAPASNTWHIQVKEEEQNFSNTSIQQIPDPLQSIMMKAKDLCSHMQRCGVNIKPTLFLPRILFLSPHCHLNEELRKRKELVSSEDVETFLRSITEGYVTWIADAITPSWISGHLSFRQLGAARHILGQLGTWDVVQLSSGTELKGDFQGCQHLALDRQETDMLEFSRGRSLSTETLWALLGHKPQYWRPRICSSFSPLLDESRCGFT
ncbi:uncharacterized protein si:zfos-911d5.4 isoform X2 [Tachysurus fulvidraco]|uniref:uncharacterized protein si:zfos-911d5.4 isoform X2 n=1 Tax=Tachysurus fulvidraco TaxID=1234273 RepID=UPI001FEDC0D8|nr:uncharacterized protein si:zfos-911d5.4 isoform X2 [Tachysurus fulvidraco]